MFQNIDVFRLASQMAQHSASRQSVIAQNIANADTPEYQARDIRPFHAQVTSADLSLKISQPSHMPFVDETRYAATTRDTDYIEPNGNTVALETEMLHASEVQRAHSRALAIYKSALNVMHRVLG
jgi:flagellar basal-body rod protein FlgB